MMPPANPASVPPQAPATAQPTGPKMTPDQASAWYRRIKASNDATKPALDAGKVNVQRYKGNYLEGRPQSDEACVPTDFWFIEQKKAGLFYRLPDVYLKALEPVEQDAAVVFQAVINAKLGAQGVNVLPRVKQVLFDVLCPTGYGALKVGFEPVLGEPQQVQTGTEPDPSVTPGAVLGLSGASQRPVFEMVPHIIAKRYFIEHVSPGDLIVPPDFVGLDFDDADFLGVRFREDVEDGAGSDADDDRRLTPLSQAARMARKKQRVGYEISYRAARFDADAKHPEHIRTFKIYEDDNDNAVDLRDSPYQEWEVTDSATKAKQKVDTWEPGAQPCGMFGHFIAPLTLRYVSDSWMVPSDCTMARNTADELSSGRTDMMRYRKRSMPQFGFDATRVDKDIQAKIERNEIGAGIGFNGPGADSTWPIQKGDFGRERFEFDTIGKQDLQQIWGLGANQTSALAEGGRTATEIQTIQAASQNRQEQEREAVMGWYLGRVVPKFAALFQLFADEDEFVELVGTDAQRLQKVDPAVQQQAAQTQQDAHVLVPWNKELIQGRFAFTAKANSQLFLDVAQYRKQMMDLYQFFANEPTVNRGELCREILQSHGFDPSKMIVAPPPKQSEPPKATFSATGIDVSPLSPQSPVVLDILSKAGLAVDPVAVQTALQMAQAMPPTATPAPGNPHAAGPETRHGGAVAQASPLSKHAAEATGAMQGSGAPAPIAPGGQL